MQTLKYRQPSYRRRLLFALVLTLTTLLGVAAYQTPLAHASSAANTGPTIHWDQSMIYPGQNDGNPEGPVGEIAVVHGAGFTAGQQVKLVIVPGDSNQDATICQVTSFGSPASAVVGLATISASGTFNASFAWPAGIGNISSPNVPNSICALNTTDNSVVSSNDDGPFTVLTQEKPTFSISASSAAAGSTVTVTGKNWVTAQPINITIASCADCDPGNSNIASATTTSIGRDTGTFSVNIPIPATMTPNNYVVNVTSQAGPLDAYRINGLGTKPLVVTAAATPTPTVVPSPSVTAASSPTIAAVPTTTTGSNTGSSNGNSGGNGLVMIMLIALAIVLLATGGVILLVLIQRRKQATTASKPTGGPPITPAKPFGAGQANQFNAARTPMTPFPQEQPMSTPNQFGNAPNNYGAYPGYNQQNQSWPGNQQNQPWQGNPPNNGQNNWQGNPQSNPGFNTFQQNQPFQPQQSNFSSGAGMGRALMNRQCLRCGNPLAPNTPMCGVCGTLNPTSNPNDPTMT